MQSGMERAPKATNIWPSICEIFLMHRTIVKELKKSLRKREQKASARVIWMAKSEHKKSFTTCQTRPRWTSINFLRGFDENVCWVRLSYYDLMMNMSKCWNWNWNSREKAKLQFAKSALIDFIQWSSNSCLSSDDMHRFPLGNSARSHWQ